MLGVKARWSKK